MKTHAVIEVEEGGMTLTIGEQHDASLQIQRCERVQTGDVSAESVATAMASFGPDAFAGARGVHVVVGDRRAHHFVTTTPKMPNGEVVNYVIREPCAFPAFAAPKSCWLRRASSARSREGG